MSFLLSDPIKQSCFPSGRWIDGNAIKVSTNIVSRVEITLQCLSQSQSEKEKTSQTKRKRDTKGMEIQKREREREREKESLFEWTA